MVRLAACPGSSPIFANSWALSSFERTTVKVWNRRLSSLTAANVTLLPALTEDLSRPKEKSAFIVMLTFTVGTGVRVGRGVNVGVGCGVGVGVGVGPGIAERKATSSINTQSSPPDMSATNLSENSLVSTSPGRTNRCIR